MDFCDNVREGELPSCELSCFSRVRVNIFSEKCFQSSGGSCFTIITYTIESNGIE
jgi:hypothetical protein